MNFIKKLFGISANDEDFIGLSSFSNNSKCLEDKKPQEKKVLRREPTLTELLKRAN